MKKIMASIITAVMLMSSPLSILAADNSSAGVVAKGELGQNTITISPTKLDLNIKAGGTASGKFNVRTSVKDIKVDVIPAVAKSKGVGVMTFVPADADISGDRVHFSTDVKKTSETEYIITVNAQADDDFIYGTFPYAVQISGSVQVGNAVISPTTLAPVITTNNPPPEVTVDYTAEIQNDKFIPDSKTLNFEVKNTSQFDYPLRGTVSVKEKLTGKEVLKYSVDAKSCYPNQSVPFTKDLTQIEDGKEYNAHISIFYGDGSKTLERDVSVFIPVNLTQKIVGPDRTYQMMLWLLLLLLLIIIIAIILIILARKRKKDKEKDAELEVLRQKLAEKELHENQTDIEA